MRVFYTIAAGSIFGNQTEVQLLRDAAGLVYYALVPYIRFLGGPRQRAEIALWCSIAEAEVRLRRAGSLSGNPGQVNSAITQMTNGFNSNNLPRPDVEIARASFSAGYPYEQEWLDEIRAEAQTRRNAGGTAQTDLYIESADAIDRVVGP